MKKEERHKFFIDVQGEMMEFDGERVKEKLNIERKNIDLKKQETYAKWELEKEATLQGLSLRERKACERNGGV